jgi:tetratricopeptide (TPR) repeat protein
MILAGYGDAENALPLLETVVDLAPQYIPARLRVGDLLLKQNRFDEAERAYAQILELSPDEAYAVLGLGRCYFEQGRWDDARQQLEEVVVMTHYQLGYDLIVTVYQELGLDRRADELRGRQRASGAFRDPADPWIEVLDRDCYDVYRLSMRAGEATRNGKPEEAIRLLKRTLELAPESTSLHFQIGTTYKGMGYITEARGHLERCIVLEPGFPDAYAHLSDLFTQAGKISESDRVLAAGLAACPDSPGLHLMYARRLEKAGRTREAILEYENSIRLRPEEADASIELANLYFQLDRIDDGVAQLRIALQSEPDNPMALTTLALGAIMAGNREEARQWMNRIAQQPRVEADQIRTLQQAYANAFGERID